MPLMIDCFKTKVDMHGGILITNQIVYWNQSTWQIVLIPINIIMVVVLMPSIVAALAEGLPSLNRFLLK